MAEVQWVRLYTSFFDNKKIRMIRRQKDGDSIVLFYLYLLTAAGKCNAQSSRTCYNDRATKFSTEGRHACLKSKSPS